VSSVVLNVTEEQVSNCLLSLVQFSYKKTLAWLGVLQFSCVRNQFTERKLTKNFNTLCRSNFRVLKQEAFPVVCWRNFLWR